MPKKVCQHSERHEDQDISLGDISEELKVNKGVIQCDPAARTYFTSFLTAILNLYIRVGCTKGD